MATATERRLTQLETEFRRMTSARSPVLERLRQDPARLMEDAGLRPDPWQTEILRQRNSRTLLLCSRQAGKSTVAAALALLEALLAPSLVLLLSSSSRQSGELFRKVFELYRDLGRPVPSAGPRDNVLKMELQNGSRIISLPATEGTIRSYSGVRLLVIDEAARVHDDLYRSVRPMLAVSNGRLIALSTPFGRRGWFFEAWQGRGRWKRVEIPASKCPRISAEFLEEELQEMGPKWFQQEYECVFQDVVGAVFTYEDVMAAADDDVEPLVLRR